MSQSHPGSLLLSTSLLPPPPTGMCSARSWGLVLFAGLLDLLRLLCPPQLQGCLAFALSTGACHSPGRLSAPRGPGPPSGRTGCGGGEGEAGLQGLMEMTYCFPIGTGGPIQPLCPVREAPAQTGDRSGCPQPPNQGNFFSYSHEEGKSQEDVKFSQPQNLSGEKKAFLDMPWNISYQ